MILVPVKNFENAKQRLASLLSAAERSELAAAMVEDVFDALADCRHAFEIAVVTGDVQARSLAVERKFAVIEDSENPGETGAIEAATRLCVERGAGYTLVLPADIPLVSPRDIDRIWTAAEHAATVLVPSANGRGSNAVLRRPADLFPLRFGNDSFLPHLAAARATGKPVQVLHLPRVGLDVDEPSDVSDLLRSPGQTRAQELLRSWRITQRLTSAVAG
jgi:2-phospho-L-lactate guanylyltransferase